MPIHTVKWSPKEIALKQVIEALRREPTLSYYTVAREYGVIRISEHLDLTFGGGAASVVSTPSGATPDIRAGGVFVRMDIGAGQPRICTVTSEVSGARTAYP